MPLGSQGWIETPAPYLAPGRLPPRQGWVTGGASQDMSVIQVRSTRPEEGPVLREIERLAGKAFRTIGMGSVADDELPSEDEVKGYAIRGRSWVAVDESDRPMGYVLVDEVDGNAHVEQISVLPESQGKGVGRALLERVRTWAIDTDRRAITLTTFADVPWNRPLYQHLGFVVLSEDEAGPELHAIVEEEADGALDPTVRVCMRIGTDVSLMEQS
jgi:GNAT superfamily N-acetyltransferase